MDNVIIIGAGPAGLTAAMEILENTKMIPIVIESDSQVGGISKTAIYKGNRIDIGGHRFFSKSNWVMDKWTQLIPMEKDGGDMLLRPRLSRILYLRKYFDYPVSPSFQTFQKLGLIRSSKIIGSYVRSILFPTKPEQNLEDFFVNRFGMELYKTFFKDYTEKVWGLPCHEISANWGAQRIKGISIKKIILHAIKKITPHFLSDKHIKIETSLIDEFLYPKFGPGQLWEKVAELVKTNGGKILLNHNVGKINVIKNYVQSISVQNLNTQEYETLTGKHFISTMPVKDLMNSINEVPYRIRDIANNLPYRDFITVGVLAKKTTDMMPDNWIYVQESDVKVGRLQIFNNWSPYLVNNKNNIWIGMEYFCNEKDDFWNMNDEEIKSFAISELEKICILKSSDVIDSVVIKVKKAYPAYFGSYKYFNEITEWTDKIANLWLIGRNGMHRYNNMDHSMLTAKFAVEQISKASSDKSSIWKINAEEEYHESK